MVKHDKLTVYPNIVITEVIQQLFNFHRKLEKSTSGKLANKLILIMNHDHT